MAAAPTARLALAVACGYLAIGAAIQVLPTVVDGPSWVVGATITAASAAAVVARPVAGRRADTRGPRGVVAWGGALAVLGGLGQLAVPSVGVLIVARLLIGAGEGVLFTAALTWVLAATPPERRGRTIGRFGLAMWGGLAAGPPLAAALSAATSPETVLWACAALPLAVLAPVAASRARPAPSPAAATLPAASPRASPPSASPHAASPPAASPPAASPRAAASPPGAPPGRRARLVPRAVLRPALALALASFGYGTLNAFLVLRFEAAAFGGAGAALGVFGGAFLLARLLGSALVDRRPTAELVGVSALTEALGLALIATAPSTAVAFAGVVLCGLGTALVYPALATLVAARAAAAERGAAVGALTSSWDVGMAVAGPAGGVAIAVADLPGPFVLAAAAAVAAATALAVHAPSREPPRLALER